MLDGFRKMRIETDDAVIHASVAGNGPPLLLLHGYPQTSAMWHKIAPRLTERFTVVATDLRGYGRSDKPKGGHGHINYSKRTMGLDQIRVMQQLGFDRFQLVGHDRGGRVAHRMALDFPEAIERLAVLDIAPTETMYALSDKRFATAYYHWYFLTQPYDLPERLIGSDPEYYLRWTLNAWSRVPDAFSDRVVAEYLRWFREPDTIHANCEDYRAAASVDLEHDAADADRLISQPLLVLWGQLGVVGQIFDVMDSWREKAARLEGVALPCGHFLPEEAPDQTFDHLSNFLKST